MAVSVPKRLFKRAVDRNLLKRRIREAYRLNKSDLYHLLEQKELKLNLVSGHPTTGEPRPLRASAGQEAARLVPNRRPSIDLLPAFQPGLPETIPAAGALTGVARAGIPESRMSPVPGA